jgi:hypothetical protein
LGGVAAFATWRACVAAESRAGQWAETHAALIPVPARKRNVRRESSLVVIVGEESLNFATVG